MAAGLASWRARVLGLLAIVMLPRCVEQPESRTLELGIDVRLNGVAIRYHEADLGVMAVGEGGSVAWRILDDDASLQTWSVGAADLHDVGNASVPEGTAWFVVGSGGTIQLAVQHDAEFTWFEQGTGTTSDLHALRLTGWDATSARVLVVGDEVVLVGEIGDALGVFTWTPVEPPPGGWGRLRAIGEREVYGDEVVREYIVAGEEGRAWVGDLASPWRALELDTTHDLRDAGFRHLCGEAGTLVECGDDGTCSVRQFGEADFESCRSDWWIDARARVFERDPEPGVDAYDHLSWQPRAADGNLFEMVMVGDGGRAIVWASHVRYCE